MPVQFHVYKIFNFEDEMIYVGQTANLHARLRDHAINDWFGMVSRVEAVECSTRHEAMTLETELIDEHQPKPCGCREP